MKHAESIAERLFHLGGIPTTKPEPINVGKSLKEMVAQDVKDEQNAITMYKGVIEAARKESDETTAFLFMENTERRGRPPRHLHDSTGADIESSVGKTPSRVIPSLF
jgi:bacterioferritin (cytochrome b1)